MATTTTTSEKVVCVFCGSSFGNDADFTTSSTSLGEALASKNWGLVYGGGTTGLMGAVAKGCSTNGGYVHGIIPDALVSKERADEDVDAFNDKLKQSVDNHQGVTPLSNEYGKTTIVPDMHTRKRMMGLEADAFIALPGGYGTLEEIMEVITWSQLGIHNKPIIFYNMNGFYDGLLTFIRSAIDSGFISEKNGDIIKVGTTVEEVLTLIEEYQVPEGRYNLKWESLGKSAH